MLAADFGFSAWALAAISQKLGTRATLEENLRPELSRTPPKERYRKSPK